MFNTICTLAVSLLVHPDVVVGIEGPTHQVGTHHVVSASQQVKDMIFPVIIALTSASATRMHNLPIANQTLHLLVSVSAVDWLLGAVLVNDGFLVEALSEVSAHLVGERAKASDLNDIVASAGQHMSIVPDEQVARHFQNLLFIGHCSILCLLDAVATCIVAVATGIVAKGQF